MGCHINRDDFSAPKSGFVLTHFLVVADQDRSREVYRRLFDGQVVVERDPVIIRATPPDPNRTSAFLTDVTPTVT